jgi:hypothetical protein
MKERILAVLNGEDIEINEGLEFAPNGPQIIPMNQICYSEHPLEIFDISEKIFAQFVAGGDFIGLQALALTSVKLYENFTLLVHSFDLNHSAGLTILDAKTQGITVDDEPCISKLQIWKCIRNLAHHVENNEGLTLLTMAKGLTLNQLVAIAAEKGIIMNFRLGPILQQVGDVPVEQTYVILITNSVFKESRDKSYYLQEKLVRRHRCQMPTVQEYVALCIFTSKCFKKCLYGRDPLTYGRSSTYAAGFFLAVGGSASGGLDVKNFHEVKEDFGAGGRRKL